MKTCLLCNEKAPDDAVTCPNDGEASWSVATPIDESPADTDDVKPKTRRVSR